MSDNIYSHLIVVLKNNVNAEAIAQISDLIMWIKDVLEVHPGESNLEMLIGQDRARDEIQTKIYAALAEVFKR